MRDALRRFSLERALQLAIVATILTAVLAAGALISWLDEARTLRWGALVALFALSLVYALRSPSGPRPWPALAATAGFLALAVASAAWSVAPGATIGRGGALALLLTACGALAWATAGDPDRVRPLLSGITAGIGLVALGGLLVLLFRHDRAIAPATTSLPARYQGLGGGPDTATMVLAVGLPLAAFAFLETRRAAGRVAAGALFLLLLGSIVASGSRGALLSGFAGLLAVVLIGQHGARRIAALAAGLAALLVLSVLAMRLPSPARTPPAQPAAEEPRAVEQPTPGYFDAETLLRLQDDVGHPPFGVGDTSRKPRTLFGTSGRAEAWQGALEQGAARPVAGYGFGTEGRVFVDRYADFHSNLAESSYVGLFLQLGAAGLAAFAALVAAFLVPAARAFRRLDPRQRRLAAACAGGLVAGLVLAFFQSYIYAAGNNATAAVWLCAFLLVAASATPHARASRR